MAVKLTFWEVVGGTSSSPGIGIAVLSFSRSYFSFIEPVYIHAGLNAYKKKSLKYKANNSLKWNILVRSRL